MDPFILENKRVILLQNIPFLSGPLKLFLLSDFFSEALSSKDKNLIESYLLEFWDDYLHEINLLEPFGLEIDLIDKIISQAEQIIPNIPSRCSNYNLEEILTRLKTSRNNLLSFLNGNPSPIHKKFVNVFPLIATDANKKFSLSFGVLQSLKVNISIAKEKNSYIFIPSSFNLDPQLIQQAESSFINSLNYIKNYKVINDKFFEIIIHFDNLYSDYYGNSFGIALTIAMIEKLSNIYNIPYQINIKDNIASTGGVDLNGVITPVTGTIIKEKINTVFYSHIKKFIVPKSDEPGAEKALLILQKKYSNRNLEIIPIKNFKDILANRELIAIEKKPLLIRGIKFLKSNWQFSSLLIFLFLFIAFISIKDLDYNPNSIDWEGTYLRILNKSGKVLQNKEYNLNRDYINSDIGIKLYCKIVDIDSDGNNEIIYACEPLTILENQEEYTRIVCKDKNDNIIWKHLFVAKISSPLEKLESDYSQKIIDTATVSGKKVLVAFATNGPSYSSAVYMLDLLTGKPVFDTLWHAGHLCDGFLKDFDNDGTKELVFIATNNGFEKSVIAVINLKNLNGQSPSSRKYMFYNKQIASFLFYFLLPNTDMSKYLIQRNMSIFPGYLLDNPHTKRIHFVLFNSHNKSHGNLSYSIDYNFQDFSISIANNFRVMRDTLVDHGRLNTPFTDTQEYKELQLKQILIWDKNKFINRICK